MRLWLPARNLCLSTSTDCKSALSGYSAGFDYVYEYKDHLGNTRLSYTDTDGNGTIDPANEIVKESNYYPFGLAHKGYNGNVSPYWNSVAKKYMFGGKEYQGELDLAWYDITARNYDPALGRWMNLDPLAEQMRRHSPYNYAFDNPIFFIDYDGMIPCPNGDCPEGIFARAASNPEVQKNIEDAKSSSKQILSGDLNIEPKLGLGVGGHGTVGTVKGEFELNVLKVSGGAKLENGEAKLNANAKVLSGAGELSIGKNSIKAEGSLVDANLDATFDKNLNVELTDSSAEGFTGEVTGQKDFTKLISEIDTGDIKIGAGIKLFKAVTLEGDVNLSKAANTAVSGFNAVGSFFNAVINEIGKAARDTMQQGTSLSK